MSAVLAARSFDFDNIDIVSQQEFAKPGAVAAGAFDSDSDRAAELAKPADERFIAVKACRHRQLAQDLAQVIERSSDMFVLVRVHPDCDHRAPPRL